MTKVKGSLYSYSESCVLLRITGRLYDSEGNLIQWWNADVIAKFKAKAQCIVDQYGNFTMSQVNMSVSVVQFCMSVCIL